ncbi:MAG: DUF2927 domain-containing protein [Paracoccaceae bacterium]
MTSIRGRTQTPIRAKNIIPYLLLGTFLGSLAGCEVAGVGTPLPDPTLAAPNEQSAESLALTSYYGRVQDGLLTQGLLRQDGGGPDVPFTQRNLVDNFVRIAMFDEYTNIGGRIVARQTASKLDKWRDPIRMQVEFGDSVDVDQRLQDSSDIAHYAARLSRITGLPIRQVRTGANFHVFVVNEDERRAMAPRIREILPGINEAALNTVIAMPRSTFCLVFALDPGNDGSYSQALAIIRGEHPNLMRLSCIHEEIAQGLGLSNDSAAARPSIFNDDEEFGLLTNHDEMLLRMLYDPRMLPGMDADAARVQAEVIAAELLAGQS